MEELLILKGRLVEAELAQHRLITGRATVTIQENERKITFTAAKSGDLQGYIDDLRRRIKALEFPITPRQGPVRFTF